MTIATAIKFSLTAGKKKGRLLPLFYYLFIVTVRQAV
jgi:hypothetical protein